MEQATWTFVNNAGNEVTVEARDEPEARHRAMFALWGRAGLYGPRWQGRGLDLKSRPPAEEAKSNSESQR